MRPGHPVHCVCVAAVVIDGDSVLLVRRRDNLEWEPPGGALEQSEFIVDALVREVREEAGVVVEAGPLTGVYQNQPHAVVTLVFMCKLIEGRPRASSETSEVRWVPLREADDFLNEDYRRWIADARSGGPTVRAQRQTFIGT